MILLVLYLTISKTGIVLIFIPRSFKILHIENKYNLKTLRQIFLLFLNRFPKKFADKSIIIKNKKTSRVQEMHILIGHIICKIAEKELIGG